MQTPEILPSLLALCVATGCVADDEPLEPSSSEFENDAEPATARTGSTLVRPDFEFRFAADMPAILDRTAADSSNYTLTQVLPVGPVQITGTVRYDETTRIATFVPDADLDSTLPFTGEVVASLAPYIEVIDDVIQAPCMDTDAIIDGVPVSDGIPSCREASGTWFHGQPLAAWGASPSEVDIFIEVDHYADDPAKPGATPQWGALERMRQAFAAKGYAVHFDVGDLYSGTYPDLAKFNLGGGDPFGSDQGKVPLPANPGNNLEMITVDPYGSCPPGGISVFSNKNFIELYRRQHFTGEGREFSFYYFVFTKEVNGGQASAQISGTNGAIPFGHSAWTTKFNDELDGTSISDHLDDPTRSLLDENCTHAFCNQIINYQAGTLMHEFGHNLGLLHHTGGPGTISSHTPNYWSVMSYQYQINGLPEDPETYDGDRFFYSSATKCGGGVHATSKADLARGPLSSWKLSDPDHFIIDYSDGDLPCLHESMTDESLGVDGVDGPSIDWDCDEVDGAGPASINEDGDAVDVICDNDDWGTIQLYHGYWEDQGDWPNDGLPYACPLSTD